MMAEQKPGNGLFGWLGRQVGHIKKAVKTDVTRKTLHRAQRVEEARLPDRPDITLRRTVIDEVIQDQKLPSAEAAADKAPDQKAPPAP